MNLRELEPRWIHPNVFVFLCPHCRKVLLSCKNVPMTRDEQYELFAKVFGEDWNMTVVPTEPEFAWNIKGTVPLDRPAGFAENLTVTPSIDASKSGHWHGFITKGDIR